MKKQWIAETVYLIAAIAFIGICIIRGTKPEKEVLSLSTTGIPEIEATDVWEKEGKEEITKEIAENNGMVTAAPVQDVIPLQGAHSLPVQGADEQGKMPGALEIKNENYEQYNNEMHAWWFRRMTDHVPSGSGEGFPIAPYDAYYLDTEVTEQDKVMYLTFDCGYENGFTPAILDTLAEKNVKATFFITKYFLTEHPEYVVRMKEEGHLVGNHTVRHLSSPELTPEELEAELSMVAKTMEELTGYQMDPFFRPPMGEYSERTLKASRDMGYYSVFWSIAYSDYDVKNQPGKAYVVDHFSKYHHNGSIILMHNTSESNKQALGDVIDLLRQEGYRLGELTEFIGESSMQ